jgi:ABC-2 type transport system permease protein
MLADLQAYSHSKLQFEFTDPLKRLAEDQQKQKYDELEAKGIEAQNLSVKTDDGVSQKVIFPFALVTYGDKSIPVKLLAIAKQHEPFAG